MKWQFWLSCLYRMRTTFLLPLARMLEAFYRAIKAVNQSLLNDPWFLTCFTGSDTVVAAHCTHGFALCGLPAQSMAAWTMNTLCDNVIALLRPGCKAARARDVTDACVFSDREEKPARDVQRSRSGRIQWLAWYFSCPCIPVETYLRLFVLHTNSVLQGTYRQLMCLG